MNDIRQLVRKNILDLKPYSSARDEFSDAKGVFLDANENPYGNWNRYPDPYQKELKNRLSQLKNVPPENLFLGNGSDEIIDLCFRIFCEPGKDKALIFTPTYGMYKVSAAINNVALLEVPLTHDFQIDTDLFLSTFVSYNLKLIFICSPNNPTGNSIRDIEFVLQNFVGIVVVDEAYIDFSEMDSVSKKLSTYPNLIVLQTLSKAFAMASLRIGIAIASTEVIGFFNKVKPPYNISRVNQATALDVLEDVTGYQNKLSEILAEKVLLTDALAQLPFVIQVFPSNANFILIKVSDADGVYNFLITNGIVIRNRTKEIADTLRITIGLPVENLKLIAALKQFQP